MENKTPTPFSFGRRNYQIMLVGLLVMAVGFILMAMDSEPYGYGFLGLTLGPIVLVIGFIIQFFAILAKPRKNV
ncbi:DUF3098 domain-containing protein [Rufibacter sediminis]|uniref:DUF3098 domain-containing protein n=1 Tax=Rufibacter sediminis TaxID=2762756 RepID=A0ABR6VLH7_9BACT|nr:DUF3098 domain-containing protein [Rufibacter sediminis]MBC3538099.1 DUF3098 domain-containing protein [Rufibacter sediminis]